MRGILPFSPDHFIIILFQHSLLAAFLSKILISFYRINHAGTCIRCLTFSITDNIFLNSFKIFSSTSVEVTSDSIAETWHSNLSRHFSCLLTCLSNNGIIFPAIIEIIEIKTATHATIKLRLCDVFLYFLSH